MSTGVAPKFATQEFAAAQKTGAARLNPKFWTAPYLELRARRIRMAEFFSRRNDWGDVLDVGAQYCPYYPFFENRCRSYTSLDIVETPIVDIVCDAEQMNLADDGFDLVICTQVLEHTQHPQRIVDECFRVLRPNGMLLLSVPSIFPVHGYPADNWRFMPQGLEFMLENFSEVTVLGEMDFAESWFSTNGQFLRTLTGKLHPLDAVIEPPMYAALNLAALAAQVILRPVTRRNFRAMSANLWAEARK
jgi:SAM-dependent methyltransferase